MYMGSEQLSSDHLYLQLLRPLQRLPSNRDTLYAGKFSPTICNYPIADCSLERDRYVVLRKRCEFRLTFAALPSAFNRVTRSVYIETRRRERTHLSCRRSSVSPLHVKPKPIGHVALVLRKTIVFGAFKPLCGRRTAYLFPYSQTFLLY